MNSDHFCFSFISIVKIKITITYKNLYPSRYTKYQKYLFNRIKNYKEDNVGWKKISQILNSEELKTPMGKVFKSNHVHSIYKKGIIRNKRLNQKRKVTKRMEVTHYKYVDKLGYCKI